MGAFGELLKKSWGGPNKTNTNSVNIEKIEYCDSCKCDRVKVDVGFLDRDEQCFSTITGDRIYPCNSKIK